MKNLLIATGLKLSFSFLVLISFSNLSFAQDNSSQNDEVQQKKERKAKSSYKISAGVNFNNLSVDAADNLESKTDVGYNLGISYKRGRFFYYEIGARYNQRAFEVLDSNDPANIMTNDLKVSAFDVPLTAGINITSFADRLIGLRVFIGAVPSFTLNKDVDRTGLEKDDIEDIMFYGQGGIGIDIAFFFVEIGYNYGFTGIINDIENLSSKFNPNQAYFNLGFRF
ncbi:PorT family protein [Winogradskyella sp. DF17]|uniref:PorT family protein n=1 Tax=Winogradskyella pelagia TaxID=2819984 RepID=A0ABS3T3X8_9FLAO|nr:outer membrane beta-barrel protein [Winogradskyella sp. DF17]MBO3117443.1 PorT family protein [Winogradskyella sp. DF17]